MSQEFRKSYHHELLIESFREWAKTKMADYPEARSLSLIVDWEVGENDFPPGTIVHRSGPSPAALLGTVRQLAKSAAIIMSEVVNRTISAEKALTNQASTPTGEAPTLGVPQS